MFKFWYEFIPKAHSVIEMGQGGLYYEKAVKPNLHSFMGSVFEEMCRYYTLEQGIQGRFDSFLTQAGSWWGVEQVEDQEGEKVWQSADIDVLAVSDTDKTAVVGECKFRNEKIDKTVYDTLLRRANLVAGKYRVTKYLFFSLTGYTDWIRDNANRDVVLFTVDDLYA